MKIKAKIKLKHCPFCGSGNVVMTNGEGVKWLAEKYRGKIRVITCADCGTCGGIFNTLALSAETAEKRAKNSWNKRAHE